ncbi:ATP-binding protein [Clostridium sp. D2Q-11]|uniref:ATP-binding protein n=1 Tax=Anaeromonas frigoriresistens TaxID=2683708 RepID=A0A942UYV2_9FIRM|nr:ATP-binding protein [Anaeromonas frigoriresistens]
MLKKNRSFDLFKLDFTDINQNLIFIGAPGTGKTHLSISLGIEACKRGKSVQFYTAATLGNLLVELEDKLELGKFLKKLIKLIY